MSAGEPEKSPTASAEPATAAEAPDKPVPADLGAIRPGAPIDLDEAAAAKPRPAQPDRERVRTQRPRDPSRPAYRVKPSEFVNRDQRRPARGGPGMALFGVVIALQLVVGALAAAALYVALWGRGAPVMTASETPRPAPTPAETGGRRRTCVSRSRGRALGAGPRRTALDARRSVRARRHA